MASGYFQAGGHASIMTPNDAGCYFVFFSTSLRHEKWDLEPTRCLVHSSFTELTDVLKDKLLTRLCETMKCSDWYSVNGDAEAKSNFHKSLQRDVARL